MGQWADLIIKGLIICTVYCVIIYLFVMSDKEKVHNIEKRYLNEKEYQ